MSPDAIGRRAYWQHNQYPAVSGGGFTFVLGDLVPEDAEFDLAALDVKHNGAAPTNLAIGLIDKGLSMQTILVSSGTTVGPVAGNTALVVGFRPITVPPRYNLFAVAENLGAGETLTLSVIYRRTEL